MHLWRDFLQIRNRKYLIFYYFFVKTKANAFNFDKYTTNVDYQGFPYDYYSIMHYDSKAFSSNGLETIVPKQAGITLIHSSKKSAITDIDVGEIRKRYKCT